MALQLRPVASSAVVAVLVGLALWPPRAVYWTGVAAVVGDGVTLAVVCLLAVALGAAFAWLAAVDVRSVAVGGVVAYAVGMAGIEATLSPDSPVHLVWYAVLVGCFVGGAALLRVAAA